MSSSNEIASTASGSGTTPASNADGIRVFLPPSTTSPSIIPPPSDDDLKPSPEELKSAFRSTLLQRHGPDAPLLTRAQREKQEARLGLYPSRNRTWTSVRIRIRFSDRTMIESTFNESDTLDSVYDFLHSCLDEQVTRGKNAVIYTAPPKVEYKREDRKWKGQTLRQLGWIPSAVVSVRWDDAEMNASGYPAPLKGQLRGRAEPVPVPPSFDQPSPAQQQGSATQSASSSASAGGNAAKPMPKWLKNIKSNLDDRQDPAKRQRLTPPEAGDRPRIHNDDMQLD
ncbi:uncharacterized protein SPSC_00816 [Sporisorium scitamineum]|uniref:UBX domain-containing protein n=1 Tax=Sporisorium scitamineum TaxID=49012 RepID=A0A0F7RZ54_9BASI|nr:hypothetical protein [Sporisorium scitamineum]CDU22186.1 uncharacterized protein SPSC_00816 [Sporisorium scitamineum]